MSIKLTQMHRYDFQGDLQNKKGFLCDIPSMCMCYKNNSFTAMVDDHVLLHVLRSIGNSGTDFNCECSLTE